MEKRQEIAGIVGRLVTCLHNAKVRKEKVGVKEKEIGTKGKRKIGKIGKKKKKKKKQSLIPNPKLRNYQSLSR